MLWVCEKCGCRFAVGLQACPECGGTRVTVYGIEGQPNPVLSTTTGEPVAALVSEPGPELAKLPAGSRVSAKRAKNGLSDEDAGKGK